TLIEFSPNDGEANDWRLRKAHCIYFAGRYDEAAKLYEELKSQYKVSPETLEIAAYQQVLANEKKWRQSFTNAIEKSKDPLKDAETQKALQALEKSIDEF